MDKLRGTTAKPPKDPPFLHVKFGVGRPPEFATHHHFAHHIALLPTVDNPLPEGLKTDVQREGICRYLTNNFKEGSPVHSVVNEREHDEGVYILVTSNWHRSSGDGKLHLSLYVYKADKHAATWHAYPDRTLSTGRRTPRPTTTAAYSTPPTLRSAQPVYMPKPSRADEDPGPRIRLDRPSAAPPELEEGPTLSTVPAVQEDDNERHLAKSENSESDEVDSLYNEAPRTRASIIGETHEISNPHAGAPVVHSAPPATSQPLAPVGHQKEDRPVAAPSSGWDMPPPDEDRPPSPNNGWIRPPVEQPTEGFDNLFSSEEGYVEQGRQQSSRRQLPSGAENVAPVYPSSTRGVVPGLGFSEDFPSLHDRRRRSETSFHHREVVEEPRRLPSASPLDNRPRQSESSYRPESNQEPERSASPPALDANSRRLESSYRRPAEQEPRSPQRRRNSPPRDSPRPRQSARVPSVSPSRSSSPSHSPPRRSRSTHVRDPRRPSSPSSSPSRRSHPTHETIEIPARALSRSPSPPRLKPSTRPVPSKNSKPEPSRHERSPSPPDFFEPPSQEIRDPFPPPRSKLAESGASRKRTDSQSRRPLRSSSVEPLEPLAPNEEAAPLSVATQSRSRDSDRNLKVLDDDENEEEAEAPKETMRRSRRDAKPRPKQDHSFDPDLLESSRSLIAKDAPLQSFPPTLKAAVGGWFKNIGEVIKTQVAQVNLPKVGAVATNDEEQEEDEEEPDEDEIAAAEERRRQRAERRKQRALRRERRARRDEETDAEKPRYTDVEDDGGHDKGKVVFNGEDSDGGSKSAKRASRAFTDTDEAPKRSQLSRSETYSGGNARERSFHRNLPPDVGDNEVLETKSAIVTRQRAKSVGAVEGNTRELDSARTPVENESSMLEFTRATEPSKATTRSRRVEEIRDKEYKDKGDDPRSSRSRNERDRRQGEEILAKNASNVSRAPSRRVKSDEVEEESQSRKGGDLHVEEDVRATPSPRSNRTHPEAPHSSSRAVRREESFEDTLSPHVSRLEEPAEESAEELRGPSHAPSSSHSEAEDTSPRTTKRPGRDSNPIKDASFYPPSAGLSQLGENLRRRAGGRDEFDEKASFLASSDVDKRRPSGSRGNDSENDARLRLVTAYEPSNEENANENVLHYRNSNQRERDRNTPHSSSKSNRGAEVDDVPARKIATTANLQKITRQPDDRNERDEDRLRGSDRPKDDDVSNRARHEDVGRSRRESLDRPDLRKQDPDSSRRNDRPRSQTENHSSLLQSSEKPPRSDRRAERSRSERDSRDSDREDARRPRPSRRSTGDNSDAPSRSSSRNSRKRETSEEETELGRLAKKNAQVNASTVSTSAIQATPRENVAPFSPTSSHPISVREELRQLKSAQVNEFNRDNALEADTPAIARFSGQEALVRGSDGAVRPLGENGRIFSSPPPVLSTNLHSSSEEEPIEIPPRRPRGRTQTLQIDPATTNAAVAQPPNPSFFLDSPDSSPVDSYRRGLPPSAQRFFSDSVSVRAFTASPDVGAPPASPVPSAGPPQHFFAPQIEEQRTRPSPRAALVSSDSEDDDEPSFNRGSYNSSRLPPVSAYGRGSPPDLYSSRPSVTLGSPASSALEKGPQSSRGAESYKDSGAGNHGINRFVPSTASSDEEISTGFSFSVKPDPKIAVDQSRYLPPRSAASGRPNGRRYVEPDADSLAVDVNTSNHRANNLRQPPDFPTASYEYEEDPYSSRGLHRRDPSFARSGRPYTFTDEEIEPTRDERKGSRSTHRPSSSSGVSTDSTTSESEDEKVAGRSPPSRTRVGPLTGSAPNNSTFGSSRGDREGSGFREYASGSRDAAAGSRDSAGFTPKFGRRAARRLGI